MRRLNMFLVAGMLVTFLLHGIMGAVKLFGGANSAMKGAAWVCVCFAAAHVVVTSVLTAQTLCAQKKSGAGYFRENKLFWARRISGFAIIIPLLMHLLIFRGENSGAFRLTVFNAGRLASQMLLAAAVAAHILTNIEPMLISFGAKKTKLLSQDIMLIMAIVLLFAAAGFAAYFLRWTRV